MNNASATVTTPPLMPTAQIGAGNLLQPLNLNNNNPSLFNNNGNSNVNNTKIPVTTPAVGSTWSDNLKSGQLNIDWDNLLTSKSSKSASTNPPSMNTLKAQVAPSMVPLAATGATTISSPTGLMQQQPQTPVINNSITGHGLANFGAMTSVKGVDQSFMGRSGLIGSQQFLMDNNNLNSINNNNNNMNLQSLDFLQ